jgi:hypothetical protein
MKSTILTRLTGDATLMALLTGGVYDDSSLPNTGLTIQYLRNQNKLSAEGLFLPFAVLRWGGERASNRFTTRKVRLDIYIYEQNGMTTVDGAALRIETLLHRWNSPNGTYQNIIDIVFEDALTPPPDPDLGNANFKVARYQVQFVNK